MNEIQSYTNHIDMDKENQPVRAHEEETAHLGSKEFFHSALMESLENCDDLSEANNIVREILKGGENILGEKANDWSHSIDDVLSQTFASKELYVDAIAEAMARTFNERISLEELEEMQREDILSRESHFGINDVVYYSLSEDKKEIHINIHNAKSISFGVMMEEFKNGLKEMAQKLQTDPALSEVNDIQARSWIIEKHPNIVKRYGFTLMGVDAASMTREDFINRYASNI